MTSILKRIEQAFTWIMILPLFFVFAIGVVPIFQKFQTYDYIGSLEYLFSSELHPYEFLMVYVLCIVSYTYCFFTIFSQVLDTYPSLQKNSLHSPLLYE